MEKGKLTRSEIQNFREILGSHHGGMGAGGKNICKIGGGNYGSVYRVHSNSLEKEVAVKKIIEEGESGRERLLYEEQQSKNFRSPALLEIYHADDQLVVMEFCRHGDLAGRIGWLNFKRLGIRTLLEKNLIPLLEALSELHGRSLVHGDIKPANILVGDGEVLKLGDFGLARRCKADGGATSADAGLLWGTPLYLCPEYTPRSTGSHARGRKSGTKYSKFSLKRNDGWALGLSLIEVLFNVEASNFLREALDEMEDTQEVIDSRFSEVWNKILLYPQKWRLFISNKLKKLKPAVEPTMELVLTQLLEPDPAQALSPEEILRKLREEPEKTREDILKNLEKEPDNRPKSKKTGMEEPLLGSAETPEMVDGPEKISDYATPERKLEQRTMVMEGMMKFETEATLFQEPAEEDEVMARNPRCSCLAAAGLPDRIVSAGRAIGDTARGAVNFATGPALGCLTATVGSAAGFVFRRIQSLFGRRREEEYNGQRLDDAKSKLLEDSGYLLNIQVPGEARARTPGLAEATGQLHLGNGNKHPTGQGSASTQLGIITDAIEDSSALGGEERDGSQMKI